MKIFYFRSTLLLSVLLIFLVANTFGESLAPQTTAPLFAHLNSINKEWSKQTDISVELMSFPVKFRNDDERIQLHLKLVEKTLRARNNSQLNENQVTNRLKNLESLIEYWQTGTFPINTGHPNRQPYFIDNFGTACAVGHLLQTSGEAAFVRQVSMEQNFAYIHELNYPELMDWAVKNGFTKDELAWIQPGYPGTYCLLPDEQETNWIDNQNIGDVISQGIETMFTLPNQSMMIVGGYFNIQHGATSIRTVAGYTGSSWVSFGNNLIGTVYTIEMYNGNIYAAGDFQLAGTNFYNIAYWDGNTWQGIQNGQMSGTIKTIANYDCNLYIGGDFTTVNGINMPNIAAWDGTNWTTAPTNCSNQIPTDALEVNGTVHAFEVYKNRLAVGGKFTNSGSNANITVEGINFWTGSWTPLLPSNGQFTSVNNLETYKDWLMVGENDIFAYNLTTWNTGYNIPIYTDPMYGDVYLPYTGGNETTMFYTDPDEGIFIYGTANSINGVFSKYYQNNNFRVRLLSGSIPAATVLNGEVYIGGNFTADYSQNYTQGGIYNWCNSNNDFSGKLMTFSPVLPIELIEFKLTLKKPNTIVLDWTTLTESNSSHFEIQQSIDENLEFITVGEIAAAGESNNQIDYQYLDDVSSLNAKQLYYRLKCVDKDGSITYSLIRTVKLGVRTTELTLFPNPSQGEVGISMYIPKSGDITINVYNLQGQLIYSQQKNYAANQFMQEQFDLESLISGLYLIEITTPGERITRKLKIIR